VDRDALNVEMTSSDKIGADLFLKAKKRKKSEKEYGKPVLKSL